MFALHELEEYVTVLPWLRDNQNVLPTFLAGAVPTSAAFVLVAGAMFFLIFLAVASLIIGNPERRLWHVVFTVLVLARLENGLVHVVQASLFHGYTPGVVTAIVIVIPMSLLVLRELFGGGMVSKRSLIWMVPTGFVVQLIAIAGLAWPVYRS
jgi:hypothetical protein